MNISGKRFKHHPRDTTRYNPPISSRQRYHFNQRHRLPALGRENLPDRGHNTHTLCDYPLPLNCFECVVNTFHFVQLVSRQTFRIPHPSCSPIILGGGGTITLVNRPVTLHHTHRSATPLSSSPQSSEHSTSNHHHNMTWLVALSALDRFENIHERSPAPWSEADANEIVSTALEINPNIDPDLVRKFANTASIDPSGDHVTSGHHHPSPSILLSPTCHLTVTHTHFHSLEIA